jgi:hypothetical protein
MRIWMWGEMKRPMREETMRIRYTHVYSDELIFSYMCYTFLDCVLGIARTCIHSMCNVCALLGEG